MNISILKALRNCVVENNFNLFKSDFSNSLNMDPYFVLEFNNNQNLMNLKLSDSSDLVISHISRA